MLTTPSVEHTTQLGEVLGRLLDVRDSRDILCLSGDLGAGKTALARGIGRGWGALENVTSPTFVFVHEHHRRRDAGRLFHIDCYRLRDAADADSIGLEEALSGEHAVMIEWPERVLPLLPPDRLWILLSQVEDADSSCRQISLEASGNSALTLLAALSASLEADAEMWAALSTRTSPANTGEPG